MVKYIIKNNIKNIFDDRILLLYLFFKIINESLIMEIILVIQPLYAPSNK